jgi:hypothetical protein
MTSLNPELLAGARSAGAELAEAERRVLTSRADYHTAVRRLHLAGASLRDIAAALACSHQRVQQIVNVSGGSWWRRGWRRRAVRDAICTWCGRPPSEVNKLVAGPDVYICDACVDAAGRVEHRSAPRDSSLARARPGARARCSFCRARPSAARALVTGPAAHVCSDCLRICRDIMGTSAG